MDYSLLDVLQIIEFESDCRDYDDIEHPQFKKQIQESSKLLKIWRILWNLTPNAIAVEKVFRKFLGGHINIGNLTIFGCNAMMFYFRLRTDNGVWSFRPPCFNIFWRTFTWGNLYFSPDGTPDHPDAERYYGNTSF